MPARLVLSAVASLTDTSVLRRSTLLRQITCARLPSAILASWSKQARRRGVRIGAPAMILLGFIHDLANGKYVDSPRDAKQLARFAAVCKEAAYLSSTGWLDDSFVEHPSLDGVWFRDFTRETLEEFAVLETTYEDREFMTEYLKQFVKALQSLWDCDFAELEADRSERELKESILRAQAAAEERRAQCAAARKRRREEMQSDEHFRKYWKQAEEGDAEAAAFFESVGWPVTEPAE